MKIHIQSIVIAFPFTIGCVLYFWRYIKKKPIPATKDILITTILFSLSCLGIRYAWEYSLLWGILYLTVCSLAGIGFFTMAIFWYKLEWKLPVYLAIFGSAIALIFFLISIPIAVIPNFMPTTNQLLDVQLDPTFLDRSISRISEGVLNFEKSLTDEKEKIRQSLNKLNEEISQQNKKIAKLQSDKSSLERQVNEYKRILELSEAQVQSIKKTLQEDRYFEYFIGFILGICSSGIVALAGFVAKRIYSSREKP